MNEALAGVAALLLINKSAGGGVRVEHRERADGVHAALQAMFDAWEREGTFHVEVAGGEDWPFLGGLRTDEEAQEEAYEKGLSNARYLEDTPHGRGAAVDVWPAGFDPWRDYDSQPGMKELMVAFGTWAEGRGLVWGGRWSRPDYPHIELPKWRSLPYPPEGA